MSERHTHQAAAALNYAQAKRLEAAGGHAACWVPTLIFYAAVQVLDARLADEGLHLKSQGDRMACVRAYAPDFRASAAYKELKTLSESWRYEGKAPRQDQIAQAWRWAETVAVCLGEDWPPRG